MPTQFRSFISDRESLPLKLAILLAVTCLITSCQSTLQCGTWNFGGNPGGGNEVSSAFTFNPAACGKNCQCNTDAMIQMVRVYDADDQMFLVAYGESAAWRDADGWQIDQQPLIGWAEGWYGLNNDGTTFDSDYNTVGSNGTPNTLYDAPSGQPADTFFYAVDVAACFQGKDCQNRILGYYFWSFVTDSSGNPQKFITGPAWQDLNVEFQSAVSKWNSWAPTSGPVGGGSTGQVLVSHAVPFPTLSDL
jgi:hypothetical protein